MCGGLAPTLRPLFERVNKVFLTGAAGVEIPWTGCRAGGLIGINAKAAPVAQDGASIGG